MKRLLSFIIPALMYVMHADQAKSLNRASRPGSPLLTSPISVVVPSLDLGAIQQTLASINCKIGNVNQGVCEDTILSVLGDACTILGISIAEALELLLECCGSDTVDLRGVFTVLSTIESQLDTIEADITNCGMPTAIRQAMIPFTINQSGLYCLAEDVTVPGGGTGITVNANDVILDLNGHQIVGGDTGILIQEGFLSSSVRNGIIRDQTGTGLQVDLFTSCDLTGVGILNAPIGATYNGANGNISNCNFLNNSSLGISLNSTQGVTIVNSIFESSGVGVQTIEALDVVIENCVFKGNSAIGLDLQDLSTFLVIKNCQVIQCGTGMQIAGQQIVVENCEVINSSGDNIFIAASGVSVVIAGCRLITSVFSNGLEINGNNVQVINSSFLQNSGNGLELTASSSNAEVVNNIANGNSVGFSNAGTNNRVYRNYATNNTTNYVGVSPVNSPGGALSANFNDFIANVSN